MQEMQETRVRSLGWEDALEKGKATHSCCCCCCCCVASVVSDSVRPHRRQPTRLCCPWDSPGQNTGVGCHFLLQCMKVKSESEVAQSCPTLSDPMDCSPPGSSVHGIFQARVLEWVPLPSPLPTPVLQYSGLENSMDGGPWWAYSPWGHKELDLIENTHM